MILFGVCALLGLLTVFIFSNFSAVFTYWRSGIFFFVILKFLALVASQWVWNINFDFCYVSYFYFRRFWGVTIKNRGVCWHYLIIFLDRYLFGISDTLFAEVIFYFI